MERTNGMIQYQWGEPNLCAEPGAAAVPSNLTGSELSIQGARRTSPNDGYTTNGRGRAGIQSVRVCCLLVSWVPCATVTFIFMMIYFLLFCFLLVYIIGHNVCGGTIRPMIISTFLSDSDTLVG